MAFAAAPEYHVFPTRERPLTPYQAVERATRETRRARARGGAARVVIADILTLAPALAGELEGVPVGTVIPHLDPRMPRRQRAVLLRRAAAAHARRPRAVARRRPAAAPRAAARPRQLNETRRRLGLPALERVHGGISEALALVATFPQLEYPRAWPAGTHVVGPLMWEPPAPDASCRPGRRAARPDRPVDLAGPGPDAAARARWRASPACRCACSPRPTGRSPPACRAAQRPARRLGLLLARDARLRARRLPRRPRHGRARAGERLRRRDRPGRRRHERERRARRVGGRRRAAAAAGSSGARGLALAVGRALARPRAARRAPADCRRGPRATTAPSRAADLVEAFAGGRAVSRVARARDERAVDAPHAAAPGGVGRDGVGADAHASGAHAAARGRVGTARSSASACRRRAA